MSTQLDHVNIFDAIKALVGDWHGINEEGEPTSITYKMTANDSALVENWTFENGMEALTIYHMDANTLMAMHYCPIGNQPRLDLKQQASNGTLTFECVSATNLKSFKDPHEHAFNLRINKDGTLYRDETYMESDGELHTNGILFTRKI